MKYKNNKYTHEQIQPNKYWNASTAISWNLETPAANKANFLFISLLHHLILYCFVYVTRHHCICWLGDNENRLLPISPRVNMWNKKTKNKNKVDIFYLNAPPPSDTQHDNEKCCHHDDKLGFCHHHGNQLARRTFCTICLACVWASLRDWASWSFFCFSLSRFSRLAFTCIMI